VSSFDEVARPDTWLARASGCLPLDGAVWGRSALGEDGSDLTGAKPEVWAGLVQREELAVRQFEFPETLNEDGSAPSPA
jgi:hypothetical protein